MVVCEDNAFYFPHFYAIALKFLEHMVGFHTAVHQYALVLVADVGAVAT